MLTVFMLFVAINPFPILPAHNKNPYKVIVEEIGIGNLATIASVFSPSGSDAATIAIAHYPESYMAQMLGTFNPSIMTSK